MQIFDGRGRILRPMEDTLRVDSTFLSYPPLARVLDMPPVELDRMRRRDVGVTVAG